MSDHQDGYSEPPEPHDGGLPSVEAMTAAIKGQGLYHGRWSTVPAGEAAARAILNAIRTGAMSDHEHQPKDQIEAATEEHGRRSECLICDIEIEESWSDGEGGSGWEPVDEWEPGIGSFQIRKDSDA